MVELVKKSKKFADWFKYKPDAKTVTEVSVMMLNLPIEFYPSRKKYGLLFIVSIGIFIFASINGYDILEDKVHHIPALIIYPLLAWATYLNYSLMVGKAAYLKIDKQGIEFKDIFRKGLVKWSEVESFSSLEAQHLKIIKWKKRKSNGIVTREESLFEKLFKTGGNFNNFYPISNEKLKLLLEMMRQKYGNYL